MLLEAGTLTYSSSLPSPSYLVLSGAMLKVLGSISEETAVVMTQLQEAAWKRKRQRAQFSKGRL